MFAQFLFASLFVVCLHTAATQFTRIPQPELGTTAHYCVGLNVDGNGNEWDSCDSPEITLNAIQIGGYSNGRLYNGLHARFAHDSINLYVLLRLKGDYQLNLTATGSSNSYSHAVAMMWKAGALARMFNMGDCVLPDYDINVRQCEAVRTNCARNPSSCSHCKDYMVDIWQMQSASPGSIPGVQYPYRGPLIFPSANGSISYDSAGQGAFQPSVGRLFSGADETGSTNDGFSMHPCLTGTDGSDSAHLRSFRNNSAHYGNQLTYAWSHSAINSSHYPFAKNGASGYYTYEFSRPLVTNEHTDAQFRVNTSAFFAIAFWRGFDCPYEYCTPRKSADHFVAPRGYTWAKVDLLPSPFLMRGSAVVPTPVMSVYLLISVFAVMKAIQLV